MVDSAGLVSLGMMLVPVGLAFSKSARRELLKRDSWTCKSDYCFGNYLGSGSLSWGGGYMVQGAHYPEQHQRAEDRDTSHGRCLCSTCHLLEEITRGNTGGAALLYSSQTIRSRDWLSQNGWVDQKMPFSWYQDFATTDEMGRMGLMQAYAERFFNFGEK